MCYIFPKEKSNTFSLCYFNILQDKSTTILKYHIFYDKTLLVIKLLKQSFSIKIKYLTIVKWKGSNIYSLR